MTCLECPFLSPSRRWPPRKQEAARLLSLGLTQRETARRVGTSTRQVKRWFRQPAFYEMVMTQLHEQWRDLEGAIVSNLLLSLDLERAVLTGEEDADSTRYHVAAKALDRLMDRWFAVSADALAEERAAWETTIVAVQQERRPSPSSSTGYTAYSSPA